MSSIWNSIKNMKGLMDLSTIGISNAAGSVISAGFWFYMAAILGPEKYGEIGYLIAIAGIASVFCMFGVGGSLTVYTAKKYDMLWPVALISISSSVIASIALYVMLDEPTLAAYVVGYVIFVLGTSDMLGRKMYRKYAIIFVLQKIFLVGLAVPLYYVVGHTGIILGVGLSMMVFLPHIIQFLKKSEMNFSKFRKKIGFMSNVYAESLTKTFSGQLDKIIIAPLLGFGLLGNYHLGIQIMSLLSILTAASMQYTLSQDASGGGINMLRKAIMAVSVLLSAVGIILSPILIPILFPEYTDAVVTTQIMCLSLVPSTVSTIYTSRFLGMEKSKFVLISTIIFLAVQIPLIYVLGSMFGLVGVTVALLIASICNAAFLWTTYKKYANKDYDKKSNVV